MCPFGPFLHAPSLGHFCAVKVEKNTRDHGFLWLRLFPCFLLWALPAHCFLRFFSLMGISRNLTAVIFIDPAFIVASQLPEIISW